MRKSAGWENCSWIQRVAAPADVPVVEVRLGGVDGDDRDAVHVHDGVALAEQLFEVDVADVAGVVVSGHDDELLAVEPLEILLRLGVLRLEAVRGEVARADDDFRLELVDLHDRPLHQVRDEIRRPAVEVGDVRDPEHGSLSPSPPRSVGSKSSAGSSEVTATVICRWPRKRLISRHIRAWTRRISPTRRKSSARGSSTSTGSPGSTSRIPSSSRGRGGPRARGLHA